MIRTTYTLAELQISNATFDEIAALLHEASHAFRISRDGIDMSGIMLTRPAAPTDTCPTCGAQGREITSHGDSERRFFCSKGCGQKQWGVPFEHRK